MRVEKWMMGWLLALASCVMAASALGGYPGTFYQIMMLLNRDRKNPRKAPSPNQLWAILDPPASLGSLSNLHLQTNRIIRSADNVGDVELIRQFVEKVESLSETPTVGEVSIETAPEDPAETAQENPAETDLEEAFRQEPVPATEPPATEEPEEEVEEETEPPITTPAPIICGGDLTIGIDPHNLTIPDGRVFLEIIETPGWEDNEYPEDFECIWNLNVQKDCLMGMTVFMVKDGYIRETAGCKDDYLKVVHPTGIESKYCGAIVSGSRSVSGTDIWTVESEVPRTIQLIFKAGVRTEQESGGGTPRGAQIEVTSYCWAFTEDLLSRTTTTSATPVEEEVEEEVVTVIADDVTEAPEDDSQSVVSSDDLKAIVEDLPTNSLDDENSGVEGQEEPVSDLGDVAGEANGDPGNLSPSGQIPDAAGAPAVPEGSNVLPEAPDEPIAPAGDSLLPEAPAGPIAPAGASVVPEAPVGPVAPAGASLLPETPAEPVAPAGASLLPEIPAAPIAPAGASLLPETPATPIAPAGASLIPEAPKAPIGPVGASSGGFIPIVPLRNSKSHWYPLLEANGMASLTSYRRK